MQVGGGGGDSAGRAYLTVGIVADGHIDISRRLPRALVDMGEQVQGDGGGFHAAELLGTANARFWYDAD